MRALLLAAVLLLACESSREYLRTDAERWTCYTRCAVEWRSNEPGALGADLSAISAGGCREQCGVPTGDPECASRLARGCSHLPTWESWSHDHAHTHAWPDEYREQCQMFLAACQRWTQ